MHSALLSWSTKLNRGRHAAATERHSPVACRDHSKAGSKWPEVKWSIACPTGQNIGQLVKISANWSKHQPNGQNIIQLVNKWPTDQQHGQLVNRMSNWSKYRPVTSFV
jgi:hypothetical protein